MELEQLEVLERKINQAVQLIENLRNQNEILVKENGELRKELQTSSQRIQQLEEQVESLNQTAGESALNKEKEEKIKSKVENMLVKLEELQYNL